MRFIVLVKASKDSEAGVMPSQELLTAMGNYNEELVFLPEDFGEALTPELKAQEDRQREQAARNAKR